MSEQSIAEKAVDLFFKRYPASNGNLGLQNRCRQDLVAIIQQAIDEANTANEADAERIWKETGGVDKEGKQWLTPRMHRKANKLIAAWEMEAKGE